MNRSLFLRSLLPCLATLAMGCLDGTPPEPAPTDLDGNLAWFWANSLTAKDAELATGVVNLGAASRVNERKKDTPNKGSLTRLAADQLTGFELGQENDPSAAAGVFLLNIFNCTMDKLEPVVKQLDQSSLRPGSYKSYVRTFTSDEAAYVEGREPVLRWDTDTTIDLPVPISQTYQSNLKGTLRRLEPTGELTAPVLINHTWLMQPAVWNEGSASSFHQDYQIEVFWERSPGEMFHAYGMWRQMRVTGFGFDLSTEDNEYVNIILDNLKKWDDRTAELCAQ